MKLEYPILTFVDAETWRIWLDANHAGSTGVWLRLYKKASGVVSVTYAEALDEALCYGWIDGQRKSYDELSFLQKYTPRRQKSLWSKRNIEHIERLARAGRMMPAGEIEVAKARNDGRWDVAYDSPSNMTIPESFLLILKLHPTALAKFETLNKTARYSIGWKIQTAKSHKVKEERQAKIIEELER